MQLQPFASFCMSTFKRPALLKQQLQLLLRQTFHDFDIIISDNDPMQSALVIVNEINNDKIKYFNNNENLGMIKSFNKSIERSQAKYIIMVTDDDPIDIDFLFFFYEIIKSYPNFSIYGGFVRNNKKNLELEIINPSNFIQEILHPKKTSNLLWSSCILNRLDVIKIGKIPDYGSPHLADHALLALVGAENGGVVVNKMFSSLTSHNANYSKSNFSFYVNAVDGFYNTFEKFKGDKSNYKSIQKIISIHLNHWFIINWFNLKKYFTINYDLSALQNLKAMKIDMFKLKYFYALKPIFFCKSIIFNVKKKLGFFNISQ